jgi:hypothetical protein
MGATELYAASRPTGAVSSGERLEAQLRRMQEAQNAPTAIATPPVLRQSLGDIIKRLTGIRERLAEQADRLYGPRPQPTQATGSGVSDNSGVLSTISQQLSAADELLNAIDSEINCIVNAADRL